MLRTVFTALFVVLAVQALCATAFLESGTEAIGPLPSKIRVRSAEGISWRGVLKRSAHEMLFPRQATQTSAPTSTPQTLDLVQWEKDTTAKCLDKLKGLQGKASNPAGISICYNIPYADQKSGVFAADLRLYQVAKPNLEWESVGDNLGVGLQYEAAAVAESNFNQNVTIAQSPPGSPPLVRAFSFLGMVKPEFKKPDASSDEFKRLLMPLVTLQGTRKDKSIVEIQLKTNEASFVNGQFVSQAATAPTPQPSKAIPGKAIAIMPIGLILYSIWMVMGVSIVMYGTFERRKFRDHYRKRIAQSQPGATRI